MDGTLHTMVLITGILLIGGGVITGVRVGAGVFLLDGDGDLLAGVPAGGIILLTGEVAGTDHGAGIITATTQDITAITVLVLLLTAEEVRLI